MWTYLLILFSALIFVAVYVNRARFLHKKKNTPVEAPEEKDVDDEIDEIKAQISEKNTKKDMEKAEALCVKGEERLKAGKEEEAIKFFVQALAIDELHIETLNKLAMLYMKKQMFSSAAALFKNLGKLTGEPLHYSHLGLACYQEQRFEEAKDAYQKAVELDPSRPQRYASLAQVYRSLAQFQNAIISLNKAIEIDAENLDYIFLLGEVQAENGNKKEALGIFNKLKGLTPDNQEVLDAIKLLSSDSN